MIVTLVNEGWELITQRAHALLAAKLAQQWRREARSDYWVDLLAAIVQHDDHQPAFEGDNYLTELGAPRGFTVSKAETEADLEQPKKALRDAEFRGRYVALMTSMHLSHLYGANPDKGPELEAFLDEQRGRQQDWRESLGVSKGRAEHDYAVMLWCDRCSLILCRGELPAAGRRLEVRPGPDGHRYDIWQEGEHVSVEPWPFEPGGFEVEVDFRRLGQLSFKDDRALFRAMDEAELRVRSWRFAAP